MDLSAAFIGVTGFILTILTTCAIAYINADRLQCRADAKFGKRPSKTP